MCTNFPRLCPVASPWLPLLQPATSAGQAYCFLWQWENTILTHKSVENHLKYGATFQCSRDSGGRFIRLFWSRMCGALVEDMLVKPRVNSIVVSLHWNSLLTVMVFKQQTQIEQSRKMCIRVDRQKFLNFLCNLRSENGIFRQKCHFHTLFWARGNS